MSESAAQEDDRDDLPNVRCHSAWYFRSRRHAISVGTPLQARQKNSRTIGDEATSRSARAMTWATIRPSRCLVVDTNGSINQGHSAWNRHDLSRRAKVRRQGEADVDA